MLLMSFWPAAMAVGLDTTTMSYVTPIAQYDLDLTTEKMGVLNGVAFIGNPEFEISNILSK